MTKTMQLAEESTDTFPAVEAGREVLPLGDEVVVAVATAVDVLVLDESLVLEDGTTRAAAVDEAALARLRRPRKSWTRRWQTILAEARPLLPAARLSQQMVPRLLRLLRVTTST
jgi:hypothetical protein